VAAAKPQMMRWTPPGDLNGIEVPKSPRSFDQKQPQEESTRETVKLQLYSIMSVPEYWIADLRNNRLLVYSNPVGDSYQTIRELRRGDSLAPSLLPDCVIPVDLLLP
jgi:Uma2 family endonuclease